MSKLPDSRTKLFHEQFRAVDKTSGKPIANKPYRLVLADGTEITGRTGNDGLTERVASAQAESVKLYWNEDAQETSTQCNDITEGC